jgi:zinc transport system substrate-binding protein
MKRIISLCLLLALCLFASCAPGADSGAETDTLHIVTTIFPQYDFACQIAGDNAEVTMLLPPGGESHSYEPTPKDVIAIQNCDIFIYVGGESDEWARTLLESMDTSKMEIIALIDSVEAVEEEIIDGMQIDEPEEAEYDEHVWTSPRNAKLIVQKISAALCRADSKNPETYNANTENYLQKLDALDAKFQTIADNAARKTMIFGDRFPFRYFADAYGLEYYAAFPGCSSETEPSATTVKFLIDKVNELQIPVIFHIELSSEKIAETIAESTGAKVLLLHSAHNISKEDFQNGTGYLEIMENNIGNLKAALG